MQITITIIMVNSNMVNGDFGHIPMSDLYLENCVRYFHEILQK